MNQFDPDVDVGREVEPVPVVLHGRAVTRPEALRVPVTEETLARCRELVQRGEWRVVVPTENR